MSSSNTAVKRTFTQASLLSFALLSHVFYVNALDGDLKRGAQV